MNNHEEDSENLTPEIAERIIERHIQYIDPLNHDRYKSYFTHFLASNISLVAGIIYLYDKNLYTLKNRACYIGLSFAVAWLVIMLKLAVDIHGSHKTKEMAYRILPYPKPRLNWFFRFISHIYPSWLMLLFPVGFIIIYLLLWKYLDLSCKYSL